MSIIFDEEEHAKLVLSKGKCLINNKRYFELQLVANYLRKQGEKDKEIEDTLHNIAKKTFKDYNRVKIYKRVDSMVKLSKKRKLKLSTEINITKAELDTILSEENFKIQKLMFVYLVLAKYYMSNNHTQRYYVGIKDSEIFKLCDMYVRKSDGRNMMHYLTVKDYIEPTGNQSSVIKYVNEESEPIIKLKPNEDMVYYFEQYLGGIFIHCEICGKLTKKTNNKKKYCSSCSKELNSRKQYQMSTS